MIFLASLSILLILTMFFLVVGRIFTKLLPDQFNIKENSLFIAPILGFALLVIITKYFGTFSKFSLLYSLTIFIILFAVGIIFEKNYKYLLKELGIISLFSVIVSLPVLAPLIQFDSFNTFNDTYTYLVQAQWLQNHPFSQLVQGSGNYPAESQIYLYQTQGSRMGASFFLAYVQALFGLQWSYYAYLASIAVAFSAASLAIAGAVKQATHCSLRLALTVGLLPAFTFNGFMFGAQFGFFPQTFGLCFVSGIIYLFPVLANTQNSAGKALNRRFYQLIPLSLLISALILCYNDMFLILLAGMIAYLAFIFVAGSNKIVEVLKETVITAVQVGLVLNFELLRIYKSILSGAIPLAKGQAQVGWPVNWSPLEFLAQTFGMKTALGLESNSYTGYLDLLLSNIIFPLLIIFILYLIYKKRLGLKNIFIFILVINITYIAAFIKFRYFSDGFIEGEIGNTFLQWKLSKWLSPFNITLLAILFVSGINASKYWVKNFTVTTLSLLLFYGAYIQIFVSPILITGHFMSETGRNRSGFNLFLDLRSRLEAISKDQTIFLGIPHAHHKLSQMVMYALMDRKLAGSYQDGYIRGSIPENQRDMLADDADWYLRLKPLRSEGEDPLNRIGPFYLYKTPFSFFDLVSIKDTYGEEGGDLFGRWNWVRNYATYNFRYFGSGRPPYKVRLSFEYLSNEPGRTLFINIKDNPSGNILFSENFKMNDGWSKYKSNDISISSNNILVEFYASGTESYISDSDKRIVKYVIKDIDLQQ